MAGKKRPGAEVVCPRCGNRFRLDEEITAHIREDFEKQARQRLRQELREEVEGRLEDQFERRLRDKDEQIQQRDRKLKRVEQKLREATHKAGQGDKQDLGVVRQATLQELLAARCAQDAFEPVAAGRRGADLVQVVRDGGGRTAGTILWESKRGYQSWSKGWPKKLVTDMRSAHADIGVVVSDVLPPDAGAAFCQVDGVFACDVDAAPYLAMLLRERLVEVAAARGARARRDDLKGSVYDYVSGPFVERMRSAMERMISMKSTLDKEKRAKTAEWAQREGEIEGAVLDLAGMYGDLRGIGIALPLVPDLQLPGTDQVALPAGNRGS